MITVHKTVIVPYSAEQMYHLVADIDNYCHYLPWCTKSTIMSHESDGVIGNINLEYLKVKVHLVTKNTNIPCSAITMQLVEGPFKYLAGTWLFKKLGQDGAGCKIDFTLEYQFASRVLEKLINPVFSHIANNIVTAFIKQAYQS